MDSSSLTMGLQLSTNATQKLIMILLLHNLLVTNDLLRAIQEAFNEKVSQDADAVRGVIKSISVLATDA